MSKNQKAVAALVVALAGQAYLAKVAKQQAAVLGLSVAAVAVLGLAASAAIG